VVNPTEESRDTGIQGYDEIEPNWRRTHSLDVAGRISARSFSNTRAGFRSRILLATPKALIPSLRQPVTAKRIIS